MTASERLAFNPVLPGFSPDPSICRVGDRYLVANSTFEYLPGVPIHESTDLIHWRAIGSAVTRPEAFGLETAGDSRGIYAPTIRFHDGVYYLVASQVDHEPDPQFILTASDPAGPWSEPVWVHGAAGFDPSVLFTDDTAYWCAARPARPAQFEGQTEIWVSEIDPATGTLLGEETVVWRGAAHGAVWSEGPHLFQRDGWFYLVTAEGGTFRDHAVVIARSHSVTGPYEGCPRNPILTHRHLGAAHPVQNVGHADFVQRQDGTWAAVVLGVRVHDDRHVLGRETFLADVVWEDDWPVVNPGVGMLVGVADRADAWAQQPARLAGALTVRGTPDFARQTVEGVVLTAREAVQDGPSMPSALFHRLTHDTARLAVTFGEIAEGAAAGLILRQSDAYSIRLEVHGESARVIERTGGVDAVRDGWTVDEVRGEALVADLEPSTVRFRIGDRRSCEVGTDVLSSEVAGGFVGTMWGPFVEGARAIAEVTRVEFRGLESGAPQAS